MPRIVRGSKSSYPEFTDQSFEFELAKMGVHSSPQHEESIMKRIFFLLFALSFGIAYAAITGLPKDTQGFASWKKVVTTGMPLDGPHAGKNKIVYANPIAAKNWAGKAPMPVGSLVVKTAGPSSLPDFVGIMRKTAKGWEYEEYTPSAGKYSLFLKGATCSGCHEQAKAKDFLFTR
jgi:Cytochrome P460